MFINSTFFEHQNKNFNVDLFEKTKMDSFLIEKIFLCVDNPTEFLNLSRVCLMWNHILTDRIFWKKYAKSVGLRFEKSCSVLDYVYQYLLFMRMKETERFVEDNKDVKIYDQRYSDAVVWKLDLENQQSFYASNEILPTSPKTSRFVNTMYFRRSTNFLYISNDPSPLDFHHLTGSVKDSMIHVQILTKFFNPSLADKNFHIPLDYLRQNWATTFAYVLCKISFHNNPDRNEFARFGNLVRLLSKV